MCGVSRFWLNVVLLAKTIRGGADRTRGVLNPR